MIPGEYELVSRHLTGPDKARCGDHSLVRELPDESAVVLAVCDGIGSLPCDWLASRTACLAIEHTMRSGSGDLGSRMLGSVAAAHEAVRGLDGAASGTGTTLVLGCWEMTSQLFRWVSVGDSRVYICRTSAPEQLSHDDAADAPRRIDGEVVLSAGAPVFQSGLTAAIGIGKLPPLEVETVATQPGEMVVLVTDGFHELPAFVPSLGTLLNAPGLDQAIDATLVVSHEIAGRDDATIVVLRRCDLPDYLLDECRNALTSDCTEWSFLDYPKHLLVRAVHVVLRGFLERGDEHAVERALEHIGPRSMAFTREQLSELLDEFGPGRPCQDVQLYRRLVQLAGWVH